MGPLPYFVLYGVVVLPCGRKILLGLYVDTDRPRLFRVFRYKLEQHLHFCLHAGVGPLNTPSVETLMPCSASRTMSASPVRMLFRLTLNMVPSG